MSWSLTQSLALDEQEFSRWRKLLEAETGIAMSPHLRRFMQNQISKRIQQLRCEDYDEYFQLINRGIAGRMEWQYLVDKLVVSETSFFRHPASFAFVRQLFASQINQADSFDIWSLGCASGEEPYSLAMMMEQELTYQHSAKRYSIVANDISRKEITAARLGVYSESQLQPLTEIQRANYFERVAKNRYQISEKLKQRVCFSQANVMEINSMPVVPMDLIFTQNMLVYFRKPQRLRILDYAVGRLKPGGYLLLGLGEVLNWQHPEMVLQDIQGVQVYRRTNNNEETSVDGR